MTQNAHCNPQNERIAPPCAPYSAQIAGEAEERVRKSQAGARGSAASLLAAIWEMFSASRRLLFLSPSKKKNPESHPKICTNLGKPHRWREYSDMFHAMMAQGPTACQLNRQRQKALNSCGSGVGQAADRRLLDLERPKPMSPRRAARSG